VLGGARINLEGRVGIVQAADRLKIGLCLGKSKTAGGGWEDPTTVSGRIEDEPNGERLGTEELDKWYRESLEELARIVPPEKIFFLQISGAYRISRQAAAGGQACCRWQRRAEAERQAESRLQATAIRRRISSHCRVILATGFRGWFSTKPFHRQSEEKYGGDWQGFA
jgi:hypothetical protein